MAAQPFDWVGYYNLANELAGRPNEACRRSAVSRAYYYVFHLAMARASNNGFVRRVGESTHQQLWRTYSASPDPDCKKLAQIALRLREKRERADYEKFYPRLDEDVNGLIGDAKLFADRLVALPLRFPVPLV